MSENQEPKKLSKKEFITRLKSVYQEIAVLEEDAAQLKTDAKDAGYDAALLGRVAKALANSKAQDMIEKDSVFAATVYDYEDQSEE